MDKRAVFEWDEDLTYVSHYYKIAEDGNTRIPNSNRETHYKLGDSID